MRSKRGFALLLTLTMLAFIVVVLVGLAAYTRVETAVAGNTQRQAQARENALLALNVAVAQLQKYAGVDTVVTATSTNYEPINGTHHYTGVWSSTRAEPVVTIPVDGEPPAPVLPASDHQPRIWLVSGNEFNEPDLTEGAPEGATKQNGVKFTPAIPAGTPMQTLVGAKTLGSASTARNDRWVEAPLVNITATGMPGTAPTATTTIGRYAWWVGDQGVKAPVVTLEPSTAVNYAPYNSGELRSRLPQQFSHGPSAHDATGGVVFDPLTANNATLLEDGKITEFFQMGLLRPATGTTAIGLAPLRENLHAWTTNNYAVLADTKRGGLKQDLSLSPGLLGDAFVAWANYSAYMESFVPPPVDPDPSVTPPVVTPAPPVYTGPAILPVYGPDILSPDPIRRRYRITPSIRDDDAAHQVAPILSSFLLSFSVKTENASGSSPLEVRARWRVSLWNPYTSALMPEDLRVEITGLPKNVVVINQDPMRLGQPEARFSLENIYAQPLPPDSDPDSDRVLRLALPWDSTTVPNGAPTEDRQSWLPGRVYTWGSVQGSADPVPDDGYVAQFYASDPTDYLDVTDVVKGPVGGNVAATDPCILDVSNAGRLTVTVSVQRDGVWIPIGTFRPQAFDDTFSTSPKEIGLGNYQFSYVFRLRDSVDDLTNPGAWLTIPNGDFRRRTPPSEIFFIEGDTNPASYENYITFSKPDRLLDRASNSYSYNEDVPVFELPRSPILSMGALQHLRLLGQRPFMIGNPWGVRVELNDIPTGALFDRFFFSGVVDGVAPGTTSRGDLVLPNTLLKPLRKSDFSKVTLDDLHLTVTIPGTPATDEVPEVPPTPSPAAARSSKYFLQGGAFNLNSTSVAAWISVLNGIRFSSFSYLNALESTGT
ncbi:MAG: hypothetical protein V4773_14435, partial [Verrucomicrobiota bacterium]